MAFFWQIGMAMMLLEIVVFALVIQAIGLFNTFALAALGAFAGLWLMRYQGAGALFKIVSGARLQPAQLLEAGSLMLAGLLLFIPGFLSDAAALALLIPALRRTMVRKTAGPVQTPSYQDDGVIEGKFEVVEDVPPSSSALDDRR